MLQCGIRMGLLDPGILLTGFPHVPKLPRLFRGPQGPRINRRRRLNRLRQTTPVSPADQRPRAGRAMTNSSDPVLAESAGSE
jgi:hypothetical protein